MMSFWDFRWWMALAMGTGAVCATDLGDPAPELVVGEWLNGEAVDLARVGTNVVVVDFWASWSPICRITSPRLSQLRKNFGHLGLVVVGIADENPQGVRHFVERAGERLAYPVGVDVAHKTFGSYMVPFKAGGVPHTFVIDRGGKVVWHGHPMRGLDQVVIDVLNGTYDPEAARAASKAEKRGQEYLAKARDGVDPMALKGLGKAAVKAMEDDPEALNHFAWQILTDERVRTRDRDLALAAARMAYEATKGEVAAFADTYARGLLVEGNTDAAIAMQRKAVERAGEDETLRERLEETLEEYLMSQGPAAVKLAR